jgi:hypothetical protein
MWKNVKSEKLLQMMFSNVGIIYLGQAIMVLHSTLSTVKRYGHVATLT